MVEKVTIKEVEVYIDRPVETYREVIVEKPVYIEKVVEVEKIVERPVEIIKW